MYTFDADDHLAGVEATRRIPRALKYIGPSEAEEVVHAGLPAFRVGGARFASLASQAAGYGNLTLTLEQQAAFVEEAPEIFLPIPGGWGRMGHTHIRLAAREGRITYLRHTDLNLHISQAMAWSAGRSWPVQMRWEVQGSAGAVQKG